MVQLTYYNGFPRSVSGIFDVSKCNFFFVVRFLFIEWSVDASVFLRFFLFFIFHETNSFNESVGASDKQYIAKKNDR